MNLGVLWHVYGIVCAFMVLVARFGGEGKSWRLTFAEILAATFPVGIIVSVWMVFIIACLTSAIG